MKSTFKQVLIRMPESEQQFQLQYPLVKIGEYKGSSVLRTLKIYNKRGQKIPYKRLPISASMLKLEKY